MVLLSRNIKGKMINSTQYQNQQLVSRRSIAYIITGKVIAVLALLIFIITMTVFMNIEQGLTKAYGDKADLLAYRIEKLLIAERSIQTETFAQHVIPLLQELDFASVHLDLTINSRDIGTLPPTFELKVRQILVNEAGSVQIVTLRAAHRPIGELANTQRQQVLIYALWSLLVLSALLLITIRNNVLKPLTDLVHAAQGISPANPDKRLTITRNDEFGQLSIFMNKMVDQIMSHQGQLQDALEVSQAANIAKSRFLATMSHELRTPLNAVIGYAEMMREDIKQGNQQQTLVDITQILDAAWHLLTLIDEVLDMSTIEAGKMVLHVNTVLVNDLVGDINASIRPQIENKGNVLQIDVQESLDAFQTDYQRLKQILANLLDNANKFTEHGTITFTIQQSDDDSQPSVTFRVSDTGIGIRQHDLAGLFQPFNQLDNSASRPYGGTGLGLAICKQMCTLLQGEITVHSIIGEGSTFSVTIPNLPLGDSMAALEEETCLASN